ncbi:sugar nucleotide-binding protein [Sphingomonas psychrotolerans]|uniref:dTDP-4-dehydrorhamnose reductase n=1 Tax=Sphingomonas psychrotolerans TaxID=1327635 RepID=A0A2K8MFZ3_9SPHN|nr:sugar nucleotide-binding protein [Sphingomonas psychrotolerans]ATY30659.1 dTDP-4-dehydrorhamnose reductase [Sphingomonas psychrotolerans]
MGQHELELWAGPECTVNRVGDAFGDQFERCGHTRRLEDLDLFAGLGIKAIRYPVLWERIAPERPDVCDWRWVDPRMHRLRELGIDVIAGLVHHGSGPAYTNLLDDEGFAPGLAEHARRVAERYDWVDRYTPVNEPLTTARFSALYGHWYPHACDERSFWRALLNQIDGVRLSMAAIRSVNPGAKLVQTDDLGRTFATGEVRGQAAFDNIRRWAGWDLLCGRVTLEHPLWDHIAAFGLAGRLDAIASAPCPPDVIGLNHYLTSDRFLDHRLHRYPPHLHGGNGRQHYADVEAIRVLEPAPPGLEGVLRETWARYGIPIAVTEVHNGCTREEQMRWIAEAWDTAARLRREGVDVRAITIWSLLGSCGWNTLLTARGLYESGVFDVSGDKPRATALAALMRGLPDGESRPPAAQGAGWWRRPIRLLYPTVHCPALREAHEHGEDAPPVSAPLLILGATGTLGQAFARACAHRNIAHVLTSRHEIDLCDPDSIARTLDQHAPWAVINAAGWVRVDEAEAEAHACHEANAEGAIRLGAAAGSRGIPTLNFSSDLVFDGRAAAPYVETDAPAPLGVYGQSKLDMEEGLASLPGRHLVIRTAAFFSPFDRHNFAVAVASTLARGECYRAARDLVVSPTYVPHLVDTALDLLIDGETGLWHLTNGTAVSWADFAMMIADKLHLQANLIQPVLAEDFDLRAPRPAFVPLATTRGAGLPPLDTAIAQFASSYMHGSVKENSEAA